jgi:hypothetical protein
MGTYVRDVPGQHHPLPIQACARAPQLHSGLDDGRRAPPRCPLADGLELLLLARDLEPGRFDRAVPRWHARLCSARQSASGKAQLALAALNALPGPGAGSAVQSLAAVCETHGQGREVQVWKRSSVAADDMATAGNLARAPPSLREAGPSLDLVLLLAGVLTTGGKFVPARSAGAVELAEQPTPIAKPT